VVDKRSRYAICTIISRNYLSYAKILARSVLDHHPEISFYLLVVDTMPERIKLGPHITVLGLADLSLPHIRDMCFSYNVLELCTALKPTLLRTLLFRYEYDSVVYLDPDILIFRELAQALSKLGKSNLILTPHLLTPIPMDGLRPTEQDILLSGIYNLGFIGLKKSKQTKHFIEWWETRLRTHCRIEHGNGLFVDQKWIDLVPCLFSSTKVIRDETYNVAYWNLHARKLELYQQGFVVNGRPLTFFHFSGFDPEQPTELSSHQNRLQISGKSALGKLLRYYSKLHIQNGYRRSFNWGYEYAQLSDGRSIPLALRRLYLGLSADLKTAFGDPFYSHKGDCFVTWATTPSRHRLSPFVQHVYESNLAVRRMFPNVNGADRSAFMRWLKTSAAKALGFNQQFMHSR